MWTIRRTLNPKLYGAFSKLSVLCEPKYPLGIYLPKTVIELLVPEPQEPNSCVPGPLGLFSPSGGPATLPWDAEGCYGIRVLGFRV